MRVARHPRSAGTSTSTIMITHTTAAMIVRSQPRLASWAAGSLAGRNGEGAPAHADAHHVTSTAAGAPKPRTHPVHRDVRLIYSAV